MPAKKKDQGPSKKTENKIKEKIIEDKTFGLKNKNKSAVVQKYVKGVQQQVKGVAKGGEQARIAEQLHSKEEKKKAQADQALLASLFKTVVDMPKGQDPKSIICSYYKSGLCQKGDKCKFSHDLSSVPEKQEKIDLYKDSRSIISEITCQFFLEAVEKDRYGWFWKCPNGDECIYRHALPEGYVINKEEVKIEADEEEKPPLEEELDKERRALPIGMKPVSHEEFMAWVEENMRKREEEKIESRKHLKGVSGKALFETNAGLFQDDEDAFEDYKRDENPQEEEEEKDKRLDSEDQPEDAEKQEKSQNNGACKEEEKVEEAKPRFNEDPIPSKEENPEVNTIHDLVPN